MPDVETRVKITATEQVAAAFRAVAQQTEQMTQRVTKSQRALVAAHKSAIGQMTEAASAGYTTLERLAGYAGVGLGATALVEGVKKSVVLFANVDQQARALHVSTGESLAKINEAYERLDKVAAAARVPVEELRNAFDTLARRFTVAGAEAMLPGVAQAAAGMHANAEEVATFNTQLIKTLGLAQKDVPAAFDSLVGAAKGGGLRAAELEAGISQVSRDMADIGMKGPKALHEVEAAMEAVGEVTKDSALAIEGVQGVIDAVNTKKMDKAFLQVGINIKHELEKGAKAGLSAIDVMVEQAHKAALILQRRHPGQSLEEQYAQLSKSPAVRQSLLELYAHKDVTAAARARIDASGGAMAEAAAVMTAGASGSLQSFSNTVTEAGEAVGSFADHVWRGVERLGAGVDRLTGAIPKATPPRRPKRDPHTGAIIPGEFEPISGNASDIPGMSAALRAARPLIPSEPGSATERTAREQLEAIRRLERDKLFGGPRGPVGGLGGAAGGEVPAAGGETPGPRAPVVGGGGGRRPSYPGVPGVAAAPSSGGGGRRPSALGGNYGASPKITDAQALRNRKESWDFLKGKGLSDDAAAAIIGSEQGESNFNPMAKVRTKREHSTGSFQWDRARQAAIKAATGIDVETASHPDQLKAMWWETHHGDAGAQAAMRVAETPGSSMAQVNATWVRRFERSWNQPADIAKRSRYAARAKRDLSGGHAPAPATAAPSLAHPPMGPWKPEEHSQLEDFRHKASEPVRVKVAYDFDAADVRTHNKAYARRSFNKEARDSRYSSYSDMGTPA